MSLVNFRDFDPNLVIFNEPESREIPGGKGSYSVFKIQYNFGTEKSPKINNLNIEYPEGYTSKGIIEQVNERGQCNYSMKYKPLSFDDADIWKQKMDRFQEACINFAYKKRKVIEGLKPKTTKEILEDKMKTIAYVPFDDDGEMKEDVLPSTYLNMHPGTDRYPGLRTKFSIVTGSKIVGGKEIPITENLPWECLYNKNITHIPVMNFYRGYCNGVRLTLQNNVRRSTLSKLPEELEEYNIQQETAEKLLNKLKSNPEAFRLLQEQVLTMKNNSQENSEEDETSMPTIVDASTAVKNVVNKGQDEDDEEESEDGGDEGLDIPTM